MKLKKNIGIVSYGAYLPEYAIAAESIEQAQGKLGMGIPQSLGVKQKTVPAIDEDTATIAYQAAAQCLDRWQGKITSIGTVFVGSESHPYAVKPTGTIVKEAFGLDDQVAMADLQFACKAGTQGLQIAAAYVSAGMVQSALAIGADTAQSQPGDVLEFTAGAGGAAYLIGTQDILARLVATTSVASETPDFWRRPGQFYPEHAGRFSGEPGYFKHVSHATQLLLEETGMKPGDIDWCVFHTPNAKFPMTAAKKLGFSSEQLAHSLIVKQIGNTYAGASLLALSSVLDHAAASQKILVTSYGSGSGADSFLLETTSRLEEKRATWKNLLADQIARLQLIDYQTYQGNLKGIQH